MFPFIRYLCLPFFFMASSLPADTSSPSAIATTPSDWMSDPAVVAFYKSVNDAIAAQQEVVNQLTAALTDRALAPSDARRLVAQNAIQSLDVKVTLANRFWYDPILQSSVARDALLSVLQQGTITAADLAHLQSVLHAVRLQMSI